jgi:hypothetical protein
MNTRRNIYVQTRNEVLKIDTTHENVALQLAEIVMGKYHRPYWITTEAAYIGSQQPRMY